MRILTFLFFIFISISGYSTVEESSLYHVTITDGISNKEMKTEIENNIAALLSDFKEAMDTKRSPKCSRDHTTRDGRRNILSIWENSKMVCSKTDIEEKCITLPEGGYQIRNIPIELVDNTNTVENKELVFNLSPDGKIDNIYIAIEQVSYNDIIEQSATVQDFKRRLIIIDFVENYRTAYNRKEIKYIESVFSDNALIITGKVIKEKPNSDAALNSLNNERIEYVKQNKKDYIKNLKNVFNRNNRISVKFDNIKVLQHPKYNNLYGVTLLQEWVTSSYKDKGYLFLMIDFKNETNPLIHVRTWQPNEFRGKPLPKEDILGFKDFPSIEYIN